MTIAAFVVVCVAFAVAAHALTRQVQAQEASERDGLAAIAVLAGVFLATVIVLYLVEVYP